MQKQKIEVGTDGNRVSLEARNGHELRVVLFHLLYGGLFEKDNIQALGGMNAMIVTPADYEDADELAANIEQALSALGYAVV